MDRDIANILKNNYEEINMDASYALNLHAIGRRATRGYQRRLLTLAGAAAGIVIALLAWHFFAAIPASHAPVAHNAPAFKTPAPPPTNENLAVVPGAQPSDTSDQSDKSDRSVKPAPSAEPQPLMVVTVAQQATVGDEKLKAGTRLVAGGVIASGSKGRVTLITRLGAEVTLNSGSRVRLGTAGTFTLEAGEIYCRNRLHEISSVGTPAGRMELLGTIVDAAMKSKDSVSVAVLDGQVRLSNSHGQAVIDAGKQSMLSRTSAPEAGAPANMVEMRLSISASAIGRRGT